MYGLNNALTGLGQAIRDLACEIKNHNETRTVLQRIEQSERNIMSAIADFSAKQNAFNARQAVAVDSAVASVNGLTSDVAELNAKIEELQNSPGAITPEDQAILDSLSEQGEAVASKSEALSTALKVLDEQNPPKPPVA